MAVGQSQGLEMVESNKHSGKMQVEQTVPVTVTVGHGGLVVVGKAVVVVLCFHLLAVAVVAPLGSYQPLIHDLNSRGFERARESTHMAITAQVYKVKLFFMVF